MGDRANVLIKYGNERVCFFTHWNGSELPEVVRRALARGTSRWDDFQYLTRIIFCEMIKDDVMGLLGYGISQKPHDGEERIVTIDLNAGTVNVTGGDPVSLKEYAEGPVGWVN